MLTFLHCSFMNKSSNRHIHGSSKLKKEFSFLGNDKCIPKACRRDT